HPEDLALHQSRPVRGRDVRPRIDRARVAGAADAGADDRAGGGASADSAAVRRRRARSRNPASGRGDHLRRSVERHRARYDPDAAPVPGIRSQAARTPDREDQGRRHEHGGSLLITSKLKHEETIEMILRTLMVAAASLFLVASADAQTKGPNGGVV